METRTTTRALGELSITYTSDIDPASREALDTRVEINGTYLCTIAGEDMHKFHGELANIVDTFRI